MKILVFNPFVGECGKEEKEFYQGIAREDANLLFEDIHGFYPLDYVTYGYYRYKCGDAVIDRVLQAEKEGVDVVVVNCTYDPGVIEAREVANIPVLGCFETAVTYSTTLGNKYSIVTTDDKVGSWHEYMIRLYGLSAKFATVKNIGIQANKLFKHSSQEIFDLILQACNKCYAENGSDVVVLGCTLMGSIFSRMSNSSFNSAKVLVVDPLGVTIKIAEAKVDLLKKMGLPPSSRTNFFRSPPSGELEKLRAFYEKSKRGK